jgi:serine/threonine protein kinase
MMRKLFSSASNIPTITWGKIVSQFKLEVSVIQRTISSQTSLEFENPENKEQLELRFFRAKESPHWLTSNRVDALRRLECPNLISIKTVVLVEGQDGFGNGEPYFAVLSQANEALTLEDLLESGSYAKTDIANILAGILEGLDALHSQGIYHGNLNPKNVWVQNLGHLHVQLSGFAVEPVQGIADLQHRHEGYSAAYVSPEQIYPKKFAAQDKVQANVDFWALSMILVRLLGQPHPYLNRGRKLAEVLTAIGTGEPEYSTASIPTQWKPILEAMMVKDAEARVQTVAQLRQISSGEKVWEQAKLRTPKAMAPQPIVCPHCSASNPPESTLCKQCDLPLKNKRGLSHYRSALAMGIIMVCFSILYWLPVGFHDLKDLFGQDEDRFGWLKDLLVNIMERSEDYQDVQEKATIVMMITWGLFSLICLSLIGLFRTLWLHRSLRNAEVFWNGKEIMPTWVIWGAFAADLLALLTIPTYVGPILIWLTTSIIRLVAYQRIWKASSSKWLGGQENVWKNGKGSFIIFSWWLSSILLPFFLLMHFLPTEIKLPDFSLVVGTEWLIVAGVLSGLSWVLGTIVIGRMAYRQRKAYEAMAQK